MASALSSIFDKTCGKVPILDGLIISSSVPLSARTVVDLGQFAISFLYHFSEKSSGCLAAPRRAWLFVTFGVLDIIEPAPQFLTGR
jgi:hypothetical protein